MRKISYPSFILYIAYYMTIESRTILLYDYGYG